MFSRAVILDRDGVINADSDSFVRTVAQWRPIPGSINAIARLSQAGFCVLVATNQSGVGRGLLSLDTLNAMHDKLCDLVEEAGGQLEGIYYCPHTPEDNCRCRKPATGLIEEMLLDYDLDLSNTAIVGDSLRDLEAGVAMGCTPILVHTGKGLSTAAALQQGSAIWHGQVGQYENLAEVADMLIAEAMT